MKQLLLIICALFCAIPSGLFGQNRPYAQRILDTLTSPIFDGRGYTNDGALKAALFIEDEMQRLGLSPIRNDFKHYFSLSVNTFPSALSLNVNGRTLQRGRDFIVEPSSSSFSGTGDVQVIALGEYRCRIRHQRVLKRATQGSIVLLDTANNRSPETQQFREQLLAEFMGDLLIEESRSLTWSVSGRQKNYAHIVVRPGLIRDGDQVECVVVAEFRNSVPACNVAGYIKGSDRPDSLIFLTAHYDHLGGMGQGTYIPGANDNASGIAMLLDMANHFKLNPPSYSVVFIAFGGEEAGLVGSYHFVNELEKWFEPDKIRFVINMDLMGSGELGMMAVNGKVFTREFEMLRNINEKESLLTEVRARPKAANSDHYYFSEKGIPAFFFYLMGDYKYYHHIDDNRENLRLGLHYDRSFKLITAFMKALQQ